MECNLSLDTVYEAKMRRMIQKLESQQTVDSVNYVKLF